MASLFFEKLLKIWFIMAKRFVNDDELRVLILRDFETIATKEMSAVYRVGSKRICNMIRELGLRRDMRKLWNDESERYLIEHYADLTNVEIGKILGMTESSIAAKANKLKLLKSEAFKRKYREKSTWKKGQVSWNKGMKGLKFAGSEKGHFKKGHLPHNTKGDDATTVRKDNQGKLHEFVKISLGVWKPKRLVVWEQHNGPVKKGMCIWVKDGDTMNTSIDNLELITRKENRLRNSGAYNLCDEYVAICLTRKKPELRESVFENKELIELQRTIYKAKRLCKTEKTTTH